MSFDLFPNIPMKRPTFLLAVLLKLTLGLFALTLASCATGVESRVSKHTDVYQALTPEDKQRVTDGKIEEGMHKDAVFLAWGSPAKRTRGSKDGRGYESWIYKTYVPQISHNIGFGLGFGGGYCDPFYGGYGRGYRSYNDYSRLHYGPSVQYVPRAAAIVHFESDIVTGWETRDGA